MVKAAGRFHDEAILLRRQVEDLQVYTKYRQVRTPGDQTRIAQARIINSQEIRDAVARKISRQDAPKT